jgi:hypothetical protein
MQNNFISARNEGLLICGVPPDCLQGDPTFLAGGQTDKVVPGAKLSTTP